ncbi:protein unc-93-like A isoform X1 [Silurus asotus]|uniref:Protein unc-93-like A isoform X1 n=1 Tax=Silurus asotus TaxID=30991 RepID=A0AAD5F858_SILAS|nr:protein unc-93-like A isoform X1 [Silurus asotus]
MICFGAVNSLSSYTFGKLAQYTGRIALFCFAAVINLSSAIALLYWRPHPDQLAVFFVFPALWGMADAVWQTQTNDN